MRTWLDKQRYLVDFTVSSLARRKAKTLGLLCVYTSIVFLVSSVMLFTAALRREAVTTLARSPELLVQRMVAGRHDLVPASYAETAAAIRGVQSADGRLWGYYFDSFTQANYTVMVPPARAATKVGPRRAVVGSAVARARSLEAGSELVLLSYSNLVFVFTVAEVLPAESELFAADLVLLSEDDFRQFFRYPAGQYTDVALSVANPSEVRNVAAKVARQLPDARTILREDILRTYQSVFNWREGIVLVLLSAAVLAFAIFALEKASGLSADEKREIGILKAIGWETGDVIAMKAWEGVLVSLTAFLAGYSAAYLHVFRWSSRLFEPVLRGWSGLYPRFDLSPETDGLLVATLFLFTVLPYAVATVVPIWRAATTDPDSVMRGAL
jgi:ABC-type lipoprotein release transport system permease subunit